MLSKFIYFFIGVSSLFAYTSKAQCIANVTATPPCGASALLEVQMNKAIQYIEWSQAGNVLRTDTAVRNKNAVTVAGTGSPGNGFNQFNFPSGVFLHSSGALYVSEQTGHRVMRWDAGATQGVRVAGNGTSGSGLGNVESPLGVQVGSNDTVYVLEFGNHRITKWGPGATQGIVVAGSNTNQSGNTLNRLNQPFGFFLHDDGKVTVADHNNNRVIQFPQGSSLGTNGVVLVTVTQPMAVTFDDDGNMYVGTNAGKLYKYPPGSTTGTTVVDGTNRIRSIIVDHYDNIWVTNDTRHTVVRYDAGVTATPKETLGVDGSATSASNHLWWPPSMAMDFENGDLYVVDYGSHRIQKFTTNIKDTFTTSSAASHTITIRGFNGCTVVETSGGGGSIGITPGTNPSVCAGATSASLPYSSATGSPDQYSITWSGATGFTNVANQSLPGGSIPITVPGSATPGTYNGTLTVRNSSTGCVSNSYNISVIVTTAVAVTPGSNPSVCAGVTATSLPYSGATGTPNQYSIDWNNAAQTAGFSDVTNQTLSGGSVPITVPSGAAPATYNGALTVRNNGTGCVSTVYNISATVRPLPTATVTPSGPVEICVGQTETLTAGSGTGYNYEWKDGQGVVGSGNSYAAGTSGDYYVVVTDANNCKDSSAAVSVTEVALPQVSITPGDTAFCEGGFVRLNAISSDTGLNYRWRDGNDYLPATADFIEISESGSYSVVVERRDIPGCTDSSAVPVEIAVHPLPVPSVTRDGDTLHATSGYASYQWLVSGQPVPGETNASYVPPAKGNYAVSVTDSNGCSGTSATYPVEQVAVALVYDDHVVHVYPNPANSSVYVTSSYPVQAVLYSMEGRVLARKEGANIMFDVTFLADGIYVISITDKEGMPIRNERLVKQRQ